jgi:glutathione synthase/RimK-type ligase-like ATP-grasp enzyme
MTTIGFLACETTLPGVDTENTMRRGDAYEHDLMVGALEPALAARGFDLRVIDWEAPLADFAGIALVMLGSAWNYQDKPDAFLAKLEALEQRGITVCNSAEIVRWNCTKAYLRKLATHGARTIPTLWHKDVSVAVVLAAMDAFDCDRLVVKRQIGAGALGQELLRRDDLPDANWRFGHAAMLQPFLSAITEEGELSFVFIAGQLSHALRKRPAADDYRIQSLYGGLESTHAPSTEEVAAATAILSALPFKAPLYARIDMLRAHDGALQVMEAELIEPYLYPEQGPELGARLADAIAERVTNL